MKNILISLLLLSISLPCFCGKNGQKTYQKMLDKERQVEKRDKQIRKLKIFLESKDKEIKEIEKKHKEELEKNKQYQHEIIQENKNLIAIITGLKSKVLKKEEDIKTIGHMLDEKTNKNLILKNKIRNQRKLRLEHIKILKQNHENILNSIKQLASKTQESLENKSNEIEAQKTKEKIYEKKIKKLNNEISVHKKKTFDKKKLLLDLIETKKEKNKPVPRNWLGSTINGAARAMKCEFIKDIIDIEKTVKE